MNDQPITETIVKLVDNMSPLDNTYNELERGDIVGTTGGIVLECTKRRNRVAGDTYASWIALCFLPNNEFTPFVVWSVVARPEGFSAQHGEYERNLGDAMYRYNNR